MCYYILTDKGEDISRTTILHIPWDNFLKPEVQLSVKEYHSSLDLFLGQDQYIYEFIQDNVEAPIGSGFSNEELGMMLIAMDVDEYVEADNAETKANTYDKYIGTEICLPNVDDEKLMAKVWRKKVSSDANNGKNYNPNK